MKLKPANLCDIEPKTVVLHPSQRRGSRLTVKGGHVRRSLTPNVCVCVWLCSCRMWPLCESVCAHTVLLCLHRTFIQALCHLFVTCIVCLLCNRRTVMKLVLWNEAADLRRLTRFCCYRSFPLSRLLPIPTYQGLDYWNSAKKLRRGRWKICRVCVNNFRCSVGWTWKWAEREEG